MLAEGNLNVSALNSSIDITYILDTGQKTKFVSLVSHLVNDPAPFLSLPWYSTWKHHPAYPKYRKASVE